MLTLKSSLDAGHEPVEALEQAAALERGGLLDGPLAELDGRQAQRFTHFTRTKGCVRRLEEKGHG